MSPPPFASYHRRMPTFVPPVDREIGERLLDAFAQELVDKVRAILRDTDHATKLERVADLISKTPSAVTALAVLALVASVHELGARIDAIEADAGSGDARSAADPASGALTRRPGN